MKYYSRSDKGNFRDQNEDSFYAPECGCGFIAVADGMGGHKSGEIASRLVIESLIETLGGINPLNIAPENLVNALIYANEKVTENAKNNSQHSGMGSTATVAVIISDRAVIGHIGDSRAYLFRAGKLSQITKDHSYVQMLIDHGYIEKSQANRHPHKNIITRAIGTDDTIDVDTKTIDLNCGDTILLCTDGLNAAVSDEEIETIMSSEIADAADRLVETALKNGSQDNISVVIAHMDGGCI